MTATLTVNGIESIELQRPTVTMLAQPLRSDRHVGWVQGNEPITGDYSTSCRAIAITRCASLHRP